MDGRSRRNWKLDSRESEVEPGSFAFLWVSSRFRPDQVIRLSLVAWKGRAWDIGELFVSSNFLTFYRDGPWLGGRSGTGRLVGRGSGIAWLFWIFSLPVVTRCRSGRVAGLAQLRGRVGPGITDFVQHLGLGWEAGAGPGCVVGLGLGRSTPISVQVSEVDKSPFVRID